MYLQKSSHCLPVMLAPFWSLICVNYIFTRLHHRQMVHSSAVELRGIEFSDSPSVSCPLSVQPLYESPCQSLWSQTTIFYCMDTFLFFMLTEGFSRVSRSKVKKKITPLKEKLLNHSKSTEKKQNCVFLHHKESKSETLNAACIASYLEYTFGNFI